MIGDPRQDGGVTPTLKSTHARWIMDSGYWILDNRRGEIPISVLIVNKEGWKVDVGNRGALDHNDMS